MSYETLEHNLNCADERIKELERELAASQTRVEAMKCCGNCDHALGHRWWCGECADKGSEYRDTGRCLTCINPCRTCENTENWKLSKTRTVRDE